MPSSAAGLLRGLLASLFLALARGYGGYGDGTAYGGAGQRGSGACGIRQNLGIYETYYASINEHQYSSSLCGKCIRVRGAAGSVVAMVVDRCAGCKHGDVDLSSEGLRKATGYSWDRKPVRWEVVSCSGGDEDKSTRRSSSRRSSSRRSSRSSKKCARTCANGSRGYKCRLERRRCVAQRLGRRSTTKICARKCGSGSRGYRCRLAVRRCIVARRGL